MNADNERLKLDIQRTKCVKCNNLFNKKKDSIEKSDNQNLF